MRGAGCDHAPQWPVGIEQMILPYDVRKRGGTQAVSERAGRILLLIGSAEQITHSGRLGYRLGRRKRHLCVSDNAAAYVITLVTESPGLQRGWQSPSLTLIIVECAGGLLSTSPRGKNRRFRILLRTAADWNHHELESLTNI
jgi:hypothetical protein